jgi:coenzyme F420-0:L-glutamate ligase/coenzyme F420-1:gamma-L-glutamate ligase
MDPVARLSDAEATFLTASRTAVLATIDRDGFPRLVPICFVAAADGGTGQTRLHTPLDEKPKRVADPHDLERVRDILANPKVTLLVDRWSEDWTRLGWLRLRGRAELVEPDGPDADEHAAAVAGLRAKYPQYLAHCLEERPIIRIAVEAARSWGALANA